MKFLIVNNLPNDPNSSQAFKKYVSTIKKAVLHDKTFQDTDFQFFTIQNHDELDQYLFDPVNSYINETWGHNFDNIDIVFINGKNNGLPWHTSQAKVLILIRMCIKVNKPLFASSSAYISGIYLLSANFDQNPRILNKNPNKKIHECVY